MIRIGFMLVLLLACLRAEDFTLKLDGVEDKALVTLPANWEAGKACPAVLYYHGTNGRPSTGLMRGHTGEADWIVVGMPYAKRGTFQLTPAGMEAEVKVLRTVRDELVKRAGLDERRVYVAGFSKGGWVSGLLLQKERWLAGGAILGAGHMYPLEAVPKPFGREVPIFVGVGRHDRNYPFALRAVVFFRPLGGLLEMETWRGLGHEFPDYGSKGLREWLQLRNGEKPDPAELETELGEILALEGFEKWWGLIEFRERPFVKAAGLSERVDAARAEVEKDPAMAREARILKESRRLLAKEIGKKTIPDLEAIVLGYSKITESAKDSPQGKVAAEDSKRVLEILDAARKEEASTPTAPPPAENPRESDRDRIPRNPLVR